MDKFMIVFCKINSGFQVPKLVHICATVTVANFHQYSCYMLQMR